jgi:hypothetical protein
MGTRARSLAVHPGQRQAAQHCCVAGRGHGFDRGRQPQADGLLPKVYVRTVLEQNTLGSLIDLVASINFDAKDGGDVLGDVYEYFLGNFAGAEGKNAGEFFTTKPIVSVIVEVLAPRKGKLYDGALCAGGNVCLWQALCVVSRQHRPRYLYLWPGAQPQHLEVGGNEPGYSRAGLQPR